MLLCKAENRGGACIVSECVILVVSNSSYPFILRYYLKCCNKFYAGLVKAIAFYTFPRSDRFSEASFCLNMMKEEER